MSWDAKHLALLKELWALGQSAAQIAHRLGHSRNAVCAKLLRMGLKRGHKPSTANPKIIAACHRPVEKVMSPRKPVTRQPKEFTKRQLYAMLAEAVRNTGKTSASLVIHHRWSFLNRIDFALRKYGGRQRFGSLSGS